MSLRKKIINTIVFINILFLTNLYPRYYNPNIGRFITADTVIPNEGTELQALNRYSYCANNPIKYVDPTGHQHTVAATITFRIVGIGAGIVISPWIGLGAIAFDLLFIKDTPSQQTLNQDKMDLIDSPDRIEPNMMENKDENGVKVDTIKLKGNRKVKVGWRYVPFDDPESHIYYFKEQQKKNKKPKKNRNDILPLIILNSDPDKFDYKLDTINLSKDSTDSNETVSKIHDNNKREFKKNNRSFRNKIKDDYKEYEITE